MFTRQGTFPYGMGACDSGAAAFLGRQFPGEVWRDCDQLLGRAVVVKLLHAEEAEDTE
ncbi:hypothetical protein AB0N17_02250 [Streptomyces sp. NPDC051133]|uniref:hypothetical protein n=1 Tax=Streptomyces sp. NPDC051133 TaxID=3155521 RepID=UPI00342E46F2